MVSEMQREYTTLEANYNHTQETLRRKQRDLSDDELAMSDMCLGQEYDVLVKEVNEKVEELQVSKNYSLLSSLLKNSCVFFFFKPTIKC
jgi:hypothetical protein